jgi:hypothetical protein
MTPTVPDPTPVTALVGLVLAGPLLAVAAAVGAGLVWLAGARLGRAVERHLTHATRPTLTGLAHGVLLGAAITAGQWAAVGALTTTAAPGWALAVVLAPPALLAGLAAAHLIGAARYVQRLRRRDHHDDPTDRSPR